MNQFLSIVCFMAFHCASYGHDGVTKVPYKHNDIKSKSYKYKDISMGSFGVDLRHLCQKLNMEVISKSDAEVMCKNRQTQTANVLKMIDENEVLILPSNMTGSGAKICKPSSNKDDKIINEIDGWFCNEVHLVIPTSDMKTFIRWATRNEHSVLIKGKDSLPPLNLERKIKHKKRFKRDSRFDESSLTLSELQESNIEFLVANISGVPMLCEKDALFECRRLFPEKPETVRHHVRSLPDSQDGGRNAPAPSFEDLWFRPANEEYQSYPPAPINQNDLGDWRWSAGGGQQGNQFKLPTSLANNMTQAVYNINGVTWLCRQFRQLECYPIFDDINEGEKTQLVEPTVRPVLATSKPKPTKPPKTTFCSRVIKFKAKDSAILKFNTFDGIIRILISARRQNGEVIVMAKILNEHDTGLDIRENDPEIILDVTVDCDNINIVVDGVKYVQGYMFGRDGVRDLEIVGNLESTGMEPRAIQPPPQGRSRNDKKLLQRDAYVEVMIPNLNEDQIDAGGNVHDNDNEAYVGHDAVNDDEVYSAFGEEHDGEAKESGEEGENNVVYKENGIRGSDLDPLQVEGTGDVEVSLSDGSKNHRYQISRGPDDEVNVEIVYGPNGYDNKSLIIENKDYNYTLVVTGQNFQIIHHDTKRNVTYEHGLEDNNISGLNVAGQVRNTQVTFREEKDESENDPILEKDPIPSGLILTEEKIVSIYGNLCTEPCSQSADSSYWCKVKFGSSEQCAPKPGHTPFREKCTSECRKLDDPYYWCNIKDKPWDYCSPSLKSQEISCENDSPRVMTMEPNDCSRYIICEAGNLKLEECPVGLHFTEINQTCEWPSIKNPCNSVSNNPAQSSRNDPRSLFGSGNMNEVTNPPFILESTEEGRPPITTTTTVSSLGGERINGDTKNNILNEASDVGVHGLTSHGELCLDACERRGYKYFWCNKEGSSLGQWWDSDFCSPHPGVTHYGEECSEDSPCDQYGEKYFWCNKKAGAWGYCSPNKIYRKDSCSVDGWYALVGDCEHYVICRDGNPVVFSCLKGLYFDYLVLSCTNKENAQCVYR